MPDKYRMTPDDRDLMIRTIIGEAADQPEEGQAGVAHVIMNRLRSGRHGSSPSDVVLARGQFEPWQTRARELMGISPQSRQYQRMGDLVDRVAGGEHEDPTNGATHFLEEAIVRRRRGGSLPSWASGDGQRIGDHTFYAPEGRVGALGYAPEGRATTIAGRPASAPGGTVRLAQAGQITPDDITETLRQAGVSRTGAPSAPRAQKYIDDDIAETLRQAGVTLEGGTKPTPKPVALPEPAPGRLNDPMQTEAERTAGKLNPVTALATETPLIGPAVTAASALLRARPGREPTVPGDTFGQRAINSNSVLNEAQRIYREKNPWTTMGAGFLGSTALTGGLMSSTLGRMAMGAEGANTASKVYTGAIGGAGLNSLDAALRGESVPFGGMIGTAGGAAGPLIGAGVSGLGRGYTKLPLTSGPLAGLNSVARDKLAGAMEGESPGSLAASRQRMGPAGFFGDVNQGATDLAGGIADTPGPGKGLVRGAYQARDAGARTRIDDAITDAIGPHVDIEALKTHTTEARKAAADPLYEQWRKMEVHPTDELIALLPRLEKAGAFDAAEELSGITGQAMNKAFFKPGPRKNFPTTESWDLAKQGLDRKIDQAYRGGDKRLAAALIDLKHDLLREIEKTPAGGVWKQARQEFASRSALLDQIEAGRDTFIGGRSGTSVDELKHELKGLSKPELGARLQGVRAAADQVMGDTLIGDTSLRNKMLADNNQKKLRLLLGDDRANRLIDSMKQEQFLKQQSQDVIHGSQTTPKGERVKALQPPPFNVPNLNLTAPATWIPHDWTPAGVANAARLKRHATAINQLAPLMSTPNDAGLDRLLNAISQEGQRRSKIESGAGVVGNLLSALTAGPGTTTARRNFFPTQ